VPAVSHGNVLMASRDWRYSGRRVHALQVDVTGNDGRGRKCETDVVFRILWGRRTSLQLLYFTTTRTP